MCDAKLNHLQCWGDLNENRDFNFNVWHYLSKSDFNFNVWHYWSNSDFNFNVWHYLLNSDFNFNVWHYLLNSDCNFNVPHYLSNSDCNFIVWHYLLNSDCNFNVLLYRLSGLSPFAGEDDLETLQNVARCDWEFAEEAFSQVSPEAKDFIRRLLIRRPQ